MYDTLDTIQPHLEVILDGLLGWHREVLDSRVTGLKAKFKSTMTRLPQNNLEHSHICTHRLKNEVF